MVKRGGTKRKAEIKKITDKSSKATTFTKRRDGLFSKAAQLCLLGDAQIAVLATPSSSNSNVSFFSFGHSSVVSAYLSGQRPVPVSVPEESKETKEDIGICMARKDLGLVYWWDDEKLERSKDHQEIMQAIESLKILQRDAERLLEDEAIDFDHEKKSKSEDNQTLIVEDELLRSSSNDIAEQTLVTTKDDQINIMSVSDNFCNNAALSHAEEKFQECSNMDLEQTEDEVVDFDQREGSLVVNEKKEKMSESEVDQRIEAVSKNSCNSNNNNINDQNLLDLDLANVDLDTIYEGLANLDGDFVDSFLML